MHLLKQKTKPVCKRRHRKNYSLIEDELDAEVINMSAMSEHLDRLSKVKPQTPRRVEQLPPQFGQPNTVGNEKTYES